MSALTVDIQELVYPSPFSRFQGTALAVCFLVDAAEGFDTVAIVVIAPTRKSSPARSAP